MFNILIKSAKEFSSSTTKPGDLIETFADIDDLVRDIGFKPSTPIELGIGCFVAWYRSDYN